MTQPKAGWGALGQEQTKEKRQGARESEDPPLPNMGVEEATGGFCATNL